MTIKQNLLKAVYPILVGITKLAGKNTKILRNQKTITHATSVYDLYFRESNGLEISLEKFKGKKILFVNTASDCGYTPQYKQLQQLHVQCGEKVVVLGFPSNDFGEQEKGNDEAIEQFCTINFGVTFPLAKKSVVIKSGLQNEIYQWLTDEQKNGWNKQPPTWNFCKYLVNESGILTHYFDPSVSPVSSEVLEAISE